MTVPNKIRLEDFILGLIWKEFYSEMEGNKCRIEYYYNPTWYIPYDKLHIKLEMYSTRKGVLSSKTNKILIKIKEAILACEEHIDYIYHRETAEIYITTNLNNHERMDILARITSILEYYNVLKLWES